MLPRRCTVALSVQRFGAVRGVNGGVKGELRMEDGGCVNLARINRGRV